MKLYCSVCKVAPPEGRGQNYTIYFIEAYVFVQMIILLYRERFCVTTILLHP